MHKFIYLALIASVLTACAGGPAPAVTGNLVPAAAPADDKKMADDVAAKMAVLFLPARTRINLLQTTPDSFGASLVEALRMRGYALSEFTPAAPTGVSGVGAVGGSGQAAVFSGVSLVDTQHPKGHALTEIKSGPPAEVLSLAYVVDQPLSAGLYRVTVFINSQSISRLYQEKDGIVVPAGYWVRKE